VTTLPPYDCSADLEEDHPAPLEERTELKAARPRARYCRRPGE
jgi:hypothetical protein